MCAVQHVSDDEKSLPKVDLTDTISIGNTNCFLPAGGGPDPNECHIIADALRFESENTGITS